LNESKNDLPKERSNQHTKSSEQCDEGYSTGQILLHNIPLFSMYVIGSILVAYLNIYFAIIFIIYLPISNYFFMVYICAYCPHYGKRSSLCGYGLVTKYFSEKKRPREFKSHFKRYIAVLFPDWFVPLIAAIIVLVYSFDWLVLILLIIFIIVGFIIVPFGSKSTSCKTCKLRDQCPWMSICGR
jgi:hypothetical protein